MALFVLLIFLILLALWWCWPRISKWVSFFLTLIILPFSCHRLNDRRLESAFPKLKMYNTTQPHFSSRSTHTYQPASSKKQPADQPAPLLAPARPPAPRVIPPPRPAPPAPPKERTVSRFLCFGHFFCFQ